MERILLSRLQHYLFCPRQFALIELEDIWEENQLTALGQVMHERVNQPSHETRGTIRTVRALQLASETLGIDGIADVVEYHRQPDGSQRPYPVEYKRGKPKSHRADEVQLCAQALCLEEMNGCAVPEGALFYGETRRRQVIVFDDELRKLTHETILGCRAIVESGLTPKAHYQSHTCRQCSLRELCHPRRFSHSAQDWLKIQLGSDAEGSSESSGKTNAKNMTRSTVESKEDSP